MPKLFSSNVSKQTRDGRREGQPLQEECGDVTVDSLFHMIKSLEKHVKDIQDQLGSVVTSSRTEDSDGVDLPPPLGDRVSSLFQDENKILKNQSPVITTDKNEINGIAMATSSTLVKEGNLQEEDNEDCCSSGREKERNLSSDCSQHSAVLCHTKRDGDEENVAAPDAIQDEDREKAINYIVDGHSFSAASYRLIGVLVGPLIPELFGLILIATVKEMLLVKKPRGKVKIAAHFSQLVGLALFVICRYYILYVNTGGVHPITGSTRKVLLSAGLLVMISHLLFALHLKRENMSGRWIIASLLGASGSALISFAFRMLSEDPHHDRGRVLFFILGWFIYVCYAVLWIAGLVEREPADNTNNNAAGDYANSQKIDSMNDNMHGGGKVQMGQGNMRQYNDTLTPFMKNHNNVLTEELKLSQNTYTMMMLSPSIRMQCYRLPRRLGEKKTIALPYLSKPWLLGLFTFYLQMILGVLIIIDQLQSPHAYGEPFMKVPIRVNRTVRFAQFITILLAIMTQTDVLGSIRVLILLPYNGKYWDKTIGENGNRKSEIWIERILIPQILKILSSIIVLFTILIIIVQSDNVVDLLKDSTALFVVLNIDNLFFLMADHGYLGGGLLDGVLSENLEKAKEARIKVESNKPKRYLQLIMIVLFCTALGFWGNIFYGQNIGRYARVKYPNCNYINPLTYANIQDGKCSPSLNTHECGSDGGDCSKFNEFYPNCNVENPDWVGNGNCDNNGDYDTPECEFDGGDCSDFNKKYPDCNVMDQYLVGNGQCEGDAYNTPACGFDGGDCSDFNKRYPDCNAVDPYLVGNGQCEGTYNTPECEFDGGDCSDFNKKYPNCNVPYPDLIGNGHCEGDAYDTPECGFDDGDCL